MSKYEMYAPLNPTREQIFVEICNAGLLSKPRPLDNNMSRKNKVNSVIFTEIRDTIQRSVLNFRSKLKIWCVTVTWTDTLIPK